MSSSGMTMATSRRGVAALRADFGVSGARLKRSEDATASRIVSHELVSMACVRISRIRAWQESGLDVLPRAERPALGATLR